MLSYNFRNFRKLWEWFSESLKSDIQDTQGGTTQEGIHCGVMGGTIDIVLKAFAGISFNDSIIRVNPYIPLAWTKLAFKILYRENWYEFNLEKNKVTIDVKGKAEPVLIEWRYKKFLSFDNGKIEVDL